jgi:hypothetical protein
VFNTVHLTPAPLAATFAKITLSLRPSQNPATTLYIEPSSFLIEGNMRWKRGQRLNLVSETDSPSPARAILREVRESLGVPVVPMLYRAYAAFPQFLELHWQAFRPAVQSRQFFLLGSRLAAESYTRAHNYFEIRGLARPATNGQATGLLPVTQVLDYYQYLDPLLLLIAAVQMQAFEGPVGQPAADDEAAGHLEFRVAPGLLSDELASPDLQRSWNERRRQCELAFIPDEHRALANFPNFYLPYWTALKALLQSPVYADCQYRLADSALEMADELPARVETELAQLLDAGLTDEQVTSLMRINEAFVEALTGLVLDITFARIGCEGGTPSEQTSHKPPMVEAPGKAGSPIRAA